MLEFGGSESGHLVTLLEICVHQIRGISGHICLEFIRNIISNYYNHNHYNFLKFDWCKELLYFSLIIIV